MKGKFGHVFIYKSIKIILTLLIEFDILITD